VTDHNWLLETLYKANKTDAETFRIFQCLSRYFNDKRDFIGIIESINDRTIRFKPLTDLADDCFFSVSVMPDVVRSRKRRRGTPGVRFYSQVGRHAYSQIGYNMIDKNWDFWVSYVNTHVSLDK
tara:strand:- start:29 stop:400 length:372 start_codon:yes stop_codon:yes gene_type:complete